MKDKDRDFYQKLRETFRSWLQSEDGKNYKWADYLLFAPDLFHLLCKVVADADVPPREKAKIAGAIAYFVSPIDLLPEAFLGPIGYVDDIVVAAYALHLLVNRIGPEVVQRHWAGDADVLGVIQQILDVAEEMVGQRIWGKLKKKGDAEDTEVTGDYQPLRAASGDYGSSRYRVEKTPKSMRILDRQSNREVFSYLVDNEPIYNYDQPGWAELRNRSRLHIQDYSISDDQKYVSLTLGNADDPKDSFTWVFEIETGKRM